MASNDDHDDCSVDRRTVLRTGAIASVGSLGLAGVSSAQASLAGEGEIQTLYSDEERVVRQFENSDGLLVAEIDLDGGSVALKGTEKSGFGAQAEVDYAKRELSETGVAPQGVLDRYWDPDIEIFSATKGSCPAIPFDNDYQAGVAIDTGLPNPRWVPKSRIANLASEAICLALGKKLPEGKIVDKIIKRIPGLHDAGASQKRVELLHDGPSGKQVETQVHPAIAVLAAVIISRGCKYFVGPMVESLFKGAGTHSIYDAHAPYWDNGWAIVMGQKPGFHPEGHDPEMIEAIAPGFHIGQFEEY